MKRIICEDMYGNELFSFSVNEDVILQEFSNCEIADVDLIDNQVTAIRVQQLEEVDKFKEVDE